MRRTPTTVLWTASVLAAVALSGCSSHHSGAAEVAATGSASAASAQAGLLTVPEKQMGHVQVVAAKLENWPRLLRLTGTVDYDQFRTTPVISQVTGPVARILATPGQRVRQGQPLLEISSPDFAQARNAYMKASDALALAKQVYRRDSDLYEHQAIAQADLEAAGSAQAQAQADFDAASQNLQILGVANPAKLASDAPAPVIALRAPIAGMVVERSVAPGQVVQANSTQCFVISDMSKVWVLANVFQSDLAYVSVGDPVEIQTDASPATFQGRIQFISPTLDATTRTVQARIETANPDGVLKKDMYVNAVVHAGTARNLIVVPDAAILRDDQNHPFVYVQSPGADNEFIHRMVTVGDSQNGFTSVTSGLRAGEKVVGDGAMFLQFANALEQ